MYTLNCKGRLWVIERPLVMGIINTTPDSFYAASRKQSVDEALNLATKMLADGADILDIGGQSTRPGSQQITADEEAEKVLPVIEAFVSKNPDAVISIDTFYASVAQQAVKAGASIVNDISGGTLDKQMLQAVAALNVPYICMHMKGNPTNMQQFAHYENVVKEVVEYFIDKVEQCRLAGIKDVIIDAGFGFAKTSTHNLVLLENLSLLKMLGKPILAGLSRKGTIYKTLGITAAEALNGTTVLNTIALMKGADILRVHDVKEAVEAVKLGAAYNEANYRESL